MKNQRKTSIPNVKKCIKALEDLTFYNVRVGQRDQNIIMHLKYLVKLLEQDSKVWHYSEDDK